MLCFNERCISLCSPDICAFLSSLLPPLTLSLVGADQQAVTEIITLTIKSGDSFSWEDFSTNIKPSLIGSDVSMYSGGSEKGVSFATPTR